MWLLLLFFFQRLLNVAKTSPIKSQRCFSIYWYYKLYFYRIKRGNFFKWLKRSKIIPTWTKVGGRTFRNLRLLVIRLPVMQCFIDGLCCVGKACDFRIMDLIYIFSKYVMFFLWRMRRMAEPCLSWQICMTKLFSLFPQWCEWGTGAGWRWKLLMMIIPILYPFIY